METGIECLGTLAGSSQLQTQECLFLSNPERGGSLVWPCFGLGLLWAELNHLTLICNFQQLINLGLFQVPPGCSPVVWAALMMCRCLGDEAELGKAWSFPFFCEGWGRAQVLVACSILLSQPQAWLECGWSWLLSPSLCFCPGTVGLLILGWGHCPAIPAIPASSSPPGEQSLVLPNNCIFPAGEFSPQVSHASLWDLLPGLFDLTTSVSRGFLRISEFNCM